MLPSEYFQVNIFFQPGLLILVAKPYMAFVGRFSYMAFVFFLVLILLVEYGLCTYALVSVWLDSSDAKEQENICWRFQEDCKKVRY